MHMAIYAYNLATVKVPTFKSLTASTSYPEVSKYLGT